MCVNVRSQKRVGENQPFPLSRNLRTQRLNFHVHAWPFIHCLYFIYARKNLRAFTRKNYATVEIHLKGEKTSPPFQKSFF